TRRIFQLQPGPGVLPHSLELEAVADDPEILHQRLDLLIAQPRQMLGVETVQHLAIAFALLQHGDPRQTGLRAFEQQHLEQMLRIAVRHTPPRVVLGLVQGIVGTPEAAGHGKSLGQDDAATITAIYLDINTAIAPDGTMPTCRTLRPASSFDILPSFPRK